MTVAGQKPGAHSKPNGVKTGSESGSEVLALSNEYTYKLIV